MVEEHENTEFLLHAYPDLQIAYLKEEPARNEGGDPHIIGSNSEFMPETGVPDRASKSDSQNHAIIFYTHHLQYSPLIRCLIFTRMQLEDGCTLSDSTIHLMANRWAIFHSPTPPV